MALVRSIRGNGQQTAEADSQSKQDQIIAKQNAVVAVQDTLVIVQAELKAKTDRVIQLSKENHQQSKMIVRQDEELMIK